jgi:hypothetical protein
MPVRVRLRCDHTATAGRPGTIMHACRRRRGHSIGRHTHPAAVPTYDYGSISMCTAPTHAAMLMHARSRDSVVIMPRRSVVLAFRADGMADGPVLPREEEDCMHCMPSTAITISMVHGACSHAGMHL